MGRMRTLRDLMSCLKGRPPQDCDWVAVVALANQSLVTPQLAGALAGRSGTVPAGIADFLIDVRRRNDERNRRLRSQLGDAITALSGAGIVPTLLKGAARWAEPAAETGFDRLLSDLDLMVAPDEVEHAMKALSGRGFSIINRYPGAAVHVVAELGRPQDVGYIDLHQRPPGPPGLCETAELADRRRRGSVDGMAVKVPDPAGQILLLLLHDQFHDGGYWRGGFDLRHLLDFARLFPTLAAADRAWLLRACGTGLVRSALAAHQVAAQRLLDVPHLGECADAASVWTYRRWLAQYAWPALRLPLATMAATIDARKILAHHRADREGRRRLFGADEAASARHQTRFARLAQILAVKPGKI